MIDNFVYPHVMTTYCYGLSVGLYLKSDEQSFTLIAIEDYMMSHIKGHRSVVECKTRYELSL